MDHLLVALLVLLASVMFGAGHAPPEHDGAIPVRLERDGDGWRLMRGGEAYVIRGAGGQSQLERLVAAGGNSIRTWSADNIGGLLDRADKLGLTVTVGIWLEHERHGFDYSDPASRAQQLAMVKRVVEAYRDHPAVLMWGVGNEVELGGDLGKAMVAVEDAAALIKSLDPNHPTMAVIAEIGDGKAKRVRELCPSIDLLGINAYGGGASIPERLNEQGYDGAYVMTEFGPRGHWEGPKTPWGAPIEPTSVEKAAMYERTYKAAVEAELGGRCLGSYVFLWGQKQETTATWFGMFLPSGEALPTVDVMQRMWTGSEPANSAPLVGVIRGPSTVTPGSQLSATVEVKDPDGDALSILWRVVAESSDRRQGGDSEQAPPEVPGLVVSSSGNQAVIEAPARPGAYRLFVYAFDGEGGAGTSNLPFLVEDSEGEESGSKP
ncbi:MAG: glycoside hydrolase family 2 TIM barrel-domain containing protein [Phycisphaerales bacterium]